MPGDLSGIVCLVTDKGGGQDSFSSNTNAKSVNCREERDGSLDSVVSISLHSVIQSGLILRIFLFWSRFKE